MPGPIAPEIPRPDPLRQRSKGQLRTRQRLLPDRKSTRLNSSHLGISYAVFCLKKKKNPPLSTQAADPAGAADCPFPNVASVLLGCGELKRTWGPASAHSFPTKPLLFFFKMTGTPRPPPPSPPRHFTI